MTPDRKRNGREHRRPGRRALHLPSAADVKALLAADAARAKPRPASAGRITAMARQVVRAAGAPPDEGDDWTTPGPPHVKLMTLASRSLADPDFGRLVDAVAGRGGEGGGS